MILGAAGRNVLHVVDAGDATPNEGTLSSSTLSGLGMSGTIQYGDIAELRIELASGGNTMTVTGTSAPTEILGSAGDDSLKVEVDLAGLAQPLLFKGGDAGTDSLSVQSNVARHLTLDKASDARGVITGAGAITFEEVETLEVTLSEDGDGLNIVDTTTPLVVNAGSGADEIVVTNVSHPTSIQLGAGDDRVTIYGAGAPVTIDGAGGGMDTLIVDRSTETAALSPEDNASIKDGASTDSGVVRNVTAADVNFLSVEEVDVLLGEGNDTFTIDHALDNTRIKVEGGLGDDKIDVLRIGGVSDTIVSGAEGDDNARVVIDGFPKAEQFTTLKLDVETLTVDNTSNTVGVAWTLRNGELLEADHADDQTAAAPFAVIDTSGADLTDILGGSESEDDSLSLVIDSASDVDGVVLGNRVELRTGLEVITPAGSKTFQSFEQVIDFVGLQSGVSTYDEDGFRLETSDSAGFDRDTTISTAARTSGEVQLFSIDVDKDPDGSGFALYSMDLAATGTGDAEVTFTGTTLSGATITQSFTVMAGTLETVELGPQFTALNDVTWTPGAETLVDNIVARSCLSRAIPRQPPGRAVTHVHGPGEHHI